MSFHRRMSSHVKLNIEDADVLSILKTQARLLDEIRIAVTQLVEYQSKEHNFKPMVSKDKEVLNLYRNQDQPTVIDVECNEL